jgi:uncharacterized protein YndB with AHSA1/START domain
MPLELLETETFAGARDGWSSSFDQLADILIDSKGENTMSKINLIAEPGKQETTTSRVFDAPRDLVFKVSNDPALIPEWWGPRYLTTTVDQMDVRPGGIWRFVQSEPDGNSYGFHGVYHSIEAPERTVMTFEFEGMPGHVLMQTTTFEEQDGKTLMTVHSVYQSVEDRDGMIQSGMEEGEAESYDRFAELLAKAVKTR